MVLLLETLAGDTDCVIADAGVAVKTLRMCGVIMNLDERLIVIIERECAQPGIDDPSGAACNFVSVAELLRT